MRFPKIPLFWQVFVLAIVATTISCVAPNKPQVSYPKDPNYKDGIFVNNEIEHPNKSFFSFLKMRWFGPYEWADHEQAAPLIPMTKADKVKIAQGDQQVTWLGHSTFLLQIKGKTILTDPMFSEYASPVSFSGPKRYTDVALNIDELPKIDVVIISHNHYDHLDKASIEQLGDEPHYFVPTGLSKWFLDLGIEQEKVTELAWWQNDVVEGIKLTAMPSQHWSARSLFDRHKTHWASWLVEVEQQSVWFAGDTGYNDKDFVAIGEYLIQQQISLELALIPIGAYGPREFMKHYHVNTEEAVQIHKDIGATNSIGMHWGTFPLTSEWPMEPYEWLQELTAQPEFVEGRFETMKIGETRAL